MIREVDAELGNLNTGVDPLVAALVYPTTAEYANEDAHDVFEVMQRSEYTEARGQQTGGQAHMFALADWEVGLNWTEDGLEDITLDRFRSNLKAMRRGWERRWRRESLRRLFSLAEVPVDPKMNTTSTSPGFAGSGTGTNVFGGRYPDGTALPGAYSHYFFDTAANRAAVTAAALSRVRKWKEKLFSSVRQ